MQTLLKVTNANVWASMEAGRSVLAIMNGMSTHESSSCGINATDSMRRPVVAWFAEARYSWML